jgi:hypothetical protein
MSDVFHEIMSIWRTVEPWQKVGIGVGVLFMFYMLATAVRPPEPRQPRPRKMEREAQNWADGYHTADSYTKRR